MADNTLLKHFFSSDGELSDEERFNLNRKSRAKRLQEIHAILRKHHYLKGFEPAEFRQLLEDLGPSFVKIGQTLSTRSEILPRTFCDELAKLQTECDPLPFSTILAVLDSVYGERRTQIFAYIDSEPLGSASLAQVHRARLDNGDIVAVKIQRPGVRDTMAQDISIMRTLAKEATFLMHDDQMLDFREVVDEMWETFLEETDFAKEAQNLEEFARLNADTVYVTCPHTYPELCNELVLVMEYVQGIPIRDPERLVECGYDLEEIGEKLLDNYASQILEHGFFHADPHPGNIIIRQGQIVYIDLGIMGRLSARDQSGFGRIIEAVGTQDAPRLKDALISFAQTKDNSAIDHCKFLADLDTLLDDYGSVGMSDIDIGNFMSDILALTRSAKVTLPSSITSMSRGIVTIEGTVAEFIPQQNIITIINNHIQRMKDPEKELVNALQDFTLALRASGAGLAEAASESGLALKMLTRGQLRMNMEMLGSDAPISKLGKIANRATMGIIIAGLFIGSSMVALSTMEPRWLGVPILSFFGYLGAFILSVWVVFDIWWRKI